MKILITGCNARACGRTPEIATHSFFWHLPRALRELGHEVDHREVIPTEELDHDFAFVGMFSVNVLSSQRYKMGAFWAAHQLPHVMCLDDWRIYDASRSLYNANQYWGCTALNGTTEKRWEKGSEVSQEIETVRNKWKARFPRTILTAFPFGDEKVFTDIHPFEELIRWDPSPLSPVMGVPVLPKLRQWVCAAQQNEDKWVEDQNPSWPVVKQYKPTIGYGAQPWAKISEADVVKHLYGPCWGVMSPFHSGVNGSGWWRPRVPYALQQTGSIVLADRDEYAPFLGDDFAVSCELVESLSDTELMALQKRQRREFEATQLSREATIMVIDNILKA